MFVCFSVCNKCNTFLCPYSTTKWSPKFTKPSAYVKFGLPSCFNCLGQCTCPHARTVREKVQAIFGYSFLSVFDIWKPFLTENEKKTEATFKKGIDKTQLFPISVWKSFKWPKCVQILSKFNFFFTPGGLNMIFRNKCHSKWSLNFTKPSAYVKFGLPSCFKLFEPMYVPACTRRMWRRACYFCDFFANFFGMIFVSFS